MLTITQKIALVQVYIHLAKGVEVELDLTKIISDPRQVMLLDHAVAIAQGNLATINTYFH